ncbi:MAG: Rrf2 family transcriptional regulator [Clostridia bacterium]|nr:Rrf2 family transcriptional regulator [Lachnospiraceae bacterium]NCC01628.1 Rrf2 family transcriptional regulator [Clostridia bacterium]NCD01668.1 Rrf2 family transcriptional regulator [Clostridia bacterium]
MTSEFTIGVHALVYLYHKNETLSSEVLAENICTNPARVRKVLAKLKIKGFVDTREGLRGGYHIGMPADKITLKDICDALQEEMVKASWKSGSADMDCLVSKGMAGIMDGLCTELNSLCLDYLDQLTIVDIEKRIFL